MRRRSIVASAPLMPLVGTLAACGGTQTAPSNAAPGAPGTPATSGPGGTPAPRAGTTPAGPAGQAAPAATAGGRRTATIELEKGGSITIELFPTEAPRWVDNFVQKANAGFYNGLLFHRVENWVVQGGDPTCRQFNPNDPANPCGRGGSNSISTEFSKRPFVAGSVGVARLPEPRDRSNDSQFFFVTQPGPAQTGGKWTQLDEQYTHFGQVIQGMEVVRAIQPGDKMRRITIQG